MSDYWSPIVSALRPYVAGEQPQIANLVKLNTNESPYGPSPGVVAAIREATGDGLRLYPDPEALSLRRAIARRYQLDVGEVFVGNGSDEILAHTFRALLNHDRPLLYPDITYSFYDTYCALFEIKAEIVPLDDAYRVQVSDYDRPCGAIILPNPNAPTGIALPFADIEMLVRRHSDKVVVIDEAYIDFGGESVSSLVPTCPNLLVIQTLSKSRGLAGLRVGFAIGQRPLIDALERVKESFNSYPLDRLALAGATAAIEDEAWFQDCRHKVMATRERLVRALVELDFQVLPSAANFVFVRHPAHGGAALLSKLRERRILVRHFNRPRIADFLRISIGTDDDCEKLVAALKQILSGRP